MTRLTKALIPAAGCGLRAHSCRAVTEWAAGRTALVVVATMLALLAGADPGSARCVGRRWLGVWAANPSDALNDGFVDQSLRLIVTPTFGGRRVRVRLSNRFG